MDERDQKRQLIDAETEGTGRLRGGVEMVHAGLDRVRLGVEDGAWFVRERVAWPVEDKVAGIGRRGAIGVFGGGGVAIAGVVVALVIAGSGGSDSSAGTTEAFVVPHQTPTPAAVAPAPKPKKRAPKPTGPTLHGAPPDFSPAQDVHAGVGDGKAVGGKQQSSGSGGVQASRGAAGETGAKGGNGTNAVAATASDAAAATAKIGATPQASTSAQAQADSLASSRKLGAAEASAGSGADDQTGTELSGPPAPKAAKRVARRFAEAFVVYEVGGIDGKVRESFSQTSTKQLSRSLLHRPPRQPASVKVPRAKVVNVVAGPSKGSVYTVSVSLLRVGVTSELRLEMEQGVGKKWQVTNVLG
jgi:hypothetical protein